VTLDADFPLACREAVDGAPAGWDYIHLSSVIKRSVLAEQSLSGGRTLIRYSRLPVNTAAYILSNSGARKWLTPTPSRRPNDLDIRYAWLADLNVLGVFPAPARQANDFPSDIGLPHGPELRSWSPGPFSEIYLEWWTARRLRLGVYVRARLANLVNSARRRLDGKRRVAVLRRT
jgi:glycosyl transferase family 25